ncbi:MAG: radical SAM protein [Candidatus Aminicenantes bacterium]|nr:radical SAM protein [Candidatus Aminicenantes bacterium]
MNPDESSGRYPSYLQLAEKGVLKKRAEELVRQYESCSLCPRDCRVDRTHGEIGKCNAGERVKISSAFPHFGEEAPLVGRKGSGTIFFSNCGLRCIYCQNYQISIQGEGIEVPDERLAQTMLKLQDIGCHNINLVTPTHYLPNIVSALHLAVQQGLHIPLVYNTGGYEKVEVLKLLDGIIDIYLPDFKYWHPAYAARYSDEAYNYPYYARLALLEMERQVGILKTGRSGVAIKGLMIRHLILPNKMAGSQYILKFISDRFPKQTYVNIMRQYRPEHRAREFEKISRRITRKEYREVLSWAKKYGIERLAK